MKCFCIFLALLFGVNLAIHAQQGIPFKSLTVGNRFVYKYFSEDKNLSPRDTVYRYYEDVLRDTTISSKRYAVIFSSFDRSLRYERSDENNLYVWRNEREELWHSWNFKQNDTTRFTFLGFNINSLMSFKVERPSKEISVVSRDTASLYSIKYAWSGNLKDDLLVVYFKKIGLTTLNFYSQIQNFPTLIIGRQFQGGIIDGVVVQDTSTRNTIVSVDGSESPISRGFAALSQPNPFTESVSLAYTLPAPAQEVELRIYSTSGALLASLRQGAQGTGKHSIEWNGKTSDGADVPQGAYFVALVVEGRKQGEMKIVRTK